MLPTFQDVHSLLVNFVADAVSIRPGCGDEKVQGLHPGIPGAFGHHIEQFPIGLGVEFIKDHTVDVEPMLGVGFCRKDLVETVGGPEYHPFLGGQDLDPLAEGRTHPNHVRRHFKYDRSLLPVCRTAIDLRPFFPVPTTEKERHRSRQLTFSLFFGDFNVGGVELPIAVGLYGAEQVPDDLLLPVDELEGMARPGSLGVAQALDKGHSIIRQFLVVGRRFGLEFCRLVFFEFPHMSDFPLPLQLDSVIHDLWSV